MSVNIDADCALGYWMSQAEKPQPCRGMSHESLYDRLEARSLPDWAYGSDGCVHVVATEKREFINRVRVSCRVASTKFPRDSIFSVDRGLSTLSPECCFVRLGSMLSFPELAKAGNLLCSSFFFDSFGGLGKRNEAITSHDRIFRLIHASSRAKGIKNARRAIRFVADGAASPPEIDSFLLLCLPVMCGGYGCPLPEFNGWVKLAPDIARDLGQENCCCDLLWRDKKCAVEYTSELHHTGYRKQSMDEMRRAALEAMGYRVFLLTKPQLYNQLAFEGFARAVMRNLGKRLPRQSAEYQATQYGLRQNLLYKPSWIISHACDKRDDGR